MVALVTQAVSCGVLMYMYAQTVIWATQWQLTENSHTCTKLHPHSPVYVPASYDSTLCIWKNSRKSASELVTMPRSWKDMTAATQAKNSCASSVESVSSAGTRCSQCSRFSQNSLAHVGIQLQPHRAHAHAYHCLQQFFNFKKLDIFFKIQHSYENV